MTVRKLPSGKWLCQCFPYGRDGKRIRRQFATKGEAIFHGRRSLRAGGAITSSSAFILLTLPFSSSEAFSGSEQHTDIHPPCWYSNIQTYAPVNFPPPAERVHTDVADFSGAFPSNWRNAMLAKNIAL